jgi:hypothetical protein
LKRFQSIGIKHTSSLSYEIRPLRTERISTASIRG